MSTEPSRETSYLRWAKLRRRVRIELTSSGVASVRRSDFDPFSGPVSVLTEGPYGHPRLLEMIAARYGVSVEQVVPVPGTSSANLIALAAVVGVGGRVALETPGYEPIRRAADFLRLRVMPVPRRPGNAFAIHEEDVEVCVDGGARAVFITNLHNPGGHLLTADKVRQLAERCARGGASLIVDEVYLDGAALIAEHPCWTAAALADNVVATSSLTKVYGLGGVRAGWLIAEFRVAERAREIVDVLHVNQPAPTASLAILAMSHMDRLEGRFRSAYHEGQAVFRRWLEQEPRIQGYPSYGAPFESIALPRGVSSDSLCDRLIQDFETGVVPGRFFGLDDHVRIGITGPQEELREGLGRISQVLDLVGRDA